MADSNVTITLRTKPELSGTSPVVGYVEAVATSTSAATIDLPLGKDATSIIGFVPNAYTTAGLQKLQTFTVSGNTVTTGAQVVGDVTKILIVYRP